MKSNQKIKKEGIKVRTKTGKLVELKTLPRIGKLVEVKTTPRIGKLLPKKLADKYKKHYVS